MIDEGLKIQTDIFNIHGIIALCIIIFSDVDGREFCMISKIRNLGREISPRPIHQSYSDSIPLIDTEIDSPATGTCPTDIDTYSLKTIIHLRKLGNSALLQRQ